MDRSHKIKTPRKSLLVTDVPTEIREALVSDAKERDIPVGEAAIQILCSAYGVKYVPTGNGLRGHTGKPIHFSAADTSTTTFVLRGGAALHRKLDRARRKRNATLRGLVLEALALHYDLTPPAVSRRPRHTKEIHA